MYINLSSFGKPSSALLFAKAIALKLRYRRRISFSLLYNLMLEYKFINRLGSPSFVVDIGANQGQFATIASLVFPHCTKIVSFEPQASLEHFLRNTKRRLGDRFTYQMFAISNVDGTGILNQTSNNEQSSLLKPADQPSHSCEVRLLDINSVLDQMPSGIFLKIDTQGHELEILSAILPRNLEKIKFLLLEAAVFPSYIQQPSFSDIYEFVFSEFPVSSMSFVDMLPGKDGIGSSECDLLFYLGR